MVSSNIDPLKSTRVLLGRKYSQDDGRQDPLHAFEVTSNKIGARLNRDLHAPAFMIEKAHTIV